MAVSAARAAAFDILMSVERQEAFAVDLLHSEKTKDLSAADAALCTQIVMGGLRWQSLLDAEIARAATQKLDVEVRIALRMAIFQMRYLERVPQRAAVHESVELVKRARKRSAAPFVNAVLRKLAEMRPYAGKTLAEKYAHPEWLVDRWTKNYGAATAETICRFDQETPATTLRLPWHGTEDAEQELVAAGIKLEPGAFLRPARHVVSGDVTATKAYREGRVAIQDEGSQLVAALVGEGQRILDCCAAPGGKTAAIAERSPEAKVTAVEIQEKRLRLMRKLVRAKNVEFVHGDATQMPVSGTFDRVLADVPCSGTGTIARNPEIKWRLREDELAGFQAKQVAILRSALAKLDRGGRLVYSTCSLEPEECEQVVERVAGGEFRVVPCAEVLRNIDALCRGPYLRTIPGVHPFDGFFAAVVERS